MSNMTFLTEDQIFGNNALDIIKKYGTKAAITDFSILLGGTVSSTIYTSEGDTLNNRTGWWWTKIPYNDNARVVNKGGGRFCGNVSKRNGGARPALPYSLISKISSNKVRGTNGILEVLYGEYPQTIVDENYSRELERAYNNDNLRKTGKSYTLDAIKYDSYDYPFVPRSFTEYKYSGLKYIRFVGDYNCDGEVISDGRTIKKGNVYWVKVEPITWLVDEQADIALSKKLIFAGVQFKNTRDYEGDFDNTDIQKFMDNYFSKDIIVNNYNTNIDINSIDELNELKKYFMEEIERNQKMIAKIDILINTFQEKERKIKKQNRTLKKMKQLMPEDTN